MWPEKFLNITSRVASRRWLGVANFANNRRSRPAKSAADGCARLDQTPRDLEQFADDAHFRADWAKVQRDVKVHLADYIHHQTGVSIDQRLQ